MKSLIIILFLASFQFLNLVSAEEEDKPDIVYKYTNAYQLIWKDLHSGANKDGAVWRVQNHQSEFCSFGDVATYLWYPPTVNAVLARSQKPGALHHPTSFSLVWEDRGSGASADVAIYKMNAPPGYTCLGAVAVGDWVTKPDASKYCCVKNEYVVQADTKMTWNDKGMGANTDVSWWTVIRAEGSNAGISAGNFIGASDYYKPKSSAAYLLKDDGRKVRQANVEVEDSVEDTFAPREKRFNRSWENKHPAQCKANGRCTGTTCGCSKGSCWTGCALKWCYSNGMFSGTQNRGYVKCSDHKDCCYGWSCGTFCRAI